MRLSRTQSGSTSGRLGRLRIPHRGGCAFIWGSGEVPYFHEVAARLGSSGSLGSFFARHVCAREICGVWELEAYEVLLSAASHEAKKQTPQTPQPPLLAVMPMILQHFFHPCLPLSTSLFLKFNLPNLQ